mmetsp:Transcript_22444/g.64493  ORF Transcript_22444/g.64493 Transcript_22444/m.64493 type:complete len:175 (-) Transcript_22444:509-1033(-)
MLFCQHESSRGRCPEQYCIRAGSQGEASGSSSSSPTTTPSALASTTTGSAWCVPTIYPYRLYCEQESSEGRCPEQYCIQATQTTAQGENAVESCSSTNPAFTSFCHGERSDGRCPEPYCTKRGSSASSESTLSVTTEGGDVDESCPPTNPAFASYCTGEYAEGRCPTPWCGASF